MHVALTAVFEPGSLSVEDGIDFASIKSHIASRLHLIPRYRQRLGFTPLMNEPMWVDDGDFPISTITCGTVTCRNQARRRS